MDTDDAAVTRTPTTALPGIGALQEEAPEPTENHQCMAAWPNGQVDINQGQEIDQG